MIKETLALVMLQVNRKNLSIEVHKDKGIPGIIYTDQDRLRQVLLNLFTNALKYTSKGIISLKVLKNNVNKHMVIFQVQDTGSGMTKAKQKELFKLLGERNENLQNQSNQITSILNLLNQIN